MLWDLRYPFLDLYHIPGHERVTGGQYYSYNVILSEKITDKRHLKLKYNVVVLVIKKLKLVNKDTVYISTH